MAQPDRIAYELANVPWKLISVKFNGEWIKKKECLRADWDKFIGQIFPYDPELGANRGVGKGKFFPSDSQREP